MQPDHPLVRDVHPEGRPYGEGHRCVPLLSATGMLNLDVVADRIMCIEVLSRPPLRVR